MDQPTIFGLDKDKLLGGGEAGKEAVIPLNEMYKKISNMLDEKLSGLKPAAGAEKGSITTINNEYDSILHTDKVVLANDMDVEDLAYKLDFYVRKMSSAKGAS